MIGFTPTINPGRFRRQKALVKQRAGEVRSAYEQRRERDPASSEVSEIYHRVFSDRKLMQEMADKNQGYVHGHMWWNRLWARIKEAFTGE
jgi:hypothetical protein